MLAAPPAPGAHHTATAMAPGAQAAGTPRPPAARAPGPCARPFPISLSFARALLIILTDKLFDMLDIFQVGKIVPLVVFLTITYIRHQILHTGAMCSFPFYFLDNVELRPRYYQMR